VIPLHPIKDWASCPTFWIIAAAFTSSELEFMIPAAVVDGVKLLPREKPKSVPVPLTCVKTPEENVNEVIFAPTHLPA
jgi:hypothetical protein